ncbi:MAG: pyrroline-5-carboxylate reductase [Candidatus Omnitrophota bacterium]
MIRRKAIGIIGCGNMGSALVDNLMKMGVNLTLFVFDKDKEKEHSLAKGFNLRVFDSVSSLASRSDCIIIAVKPQDMESVLAQMAGISGKLIISIAAGITLGYIESIIGDNSAIVRAMPNLNALIGMSVTALSANPKVGQDDLKLAEAIFKAVGEVVFVKDSQMDAVTAVSGSGPAFVAYLLKDLCEEALERIFIKEAVFLGIEALTAEILAKQTISGTRQMLKVNFDADILIKRVSSKGGTTEAGMKVLEKNGKTEYALSEAIRAACKRAGELSRRG